MKFDESGGVKLENVEKLIDLLKSPVIYANKFYITNQHDSTIRIAFSDESPDKSFDLIKNSVVMSVPSFLAFARMISRTIKYLEPPQPSESGEVENISQDKPE